MFKEALWVKKPIQGKEYEDLKKELLKEFDQQQLESINQSVSWKLYDLYTKDMCLEKRQELKGLMLSFVDTSFTYEYYEDKIIVKMRYGVQELSNKAFIITNHKEIEEFEFKQVKDADIQKRIRDELRKQAVIERALFLSSKSAFVGSIEIVTEGQEAKKIEELNTPLIWVDDVIAHLPKVLPHILGMRVSETRYIRLSSTSKIKVYISALFDCDVPGVSRSTIAKMGLVNVLNKTQLIETIRMQMQLDNLQSSIQQLLLSVATKIVYDNNIDLDSDFVEGYFSKNVIRSHAIAISSVGSFEKWLAKRNWTNEQFYREMKNMAVDQASREVLINEIFDKYIFEINQDLFQQFKDVLVNSHLIMGMDIRLDNGFEYNMSVSFKELEAFLMILKMLRPNLYESRIKGKAFPFNV